MHVELAGGIHRHTQPIIIEHFIQAHACLNATDAHTPLELRILQREQIQSGLWRAALVEGLPGMVDFPCQQSPIRGQRC